MLVASSKPRMLRLTAAYADGWNTAWLGQVDALRRPRAALEAACAEVGRNATTLEVTVGVNVAFAGLGEVPDGPTNPAKFLSGSVDEVATGLRAYAAAGVGHVIAWLYPVNAEAVARLAEAMKLART